MRYSLGMITVGGLIAVGGSVLLSGSADEAQAQSACFTQCMGSGWGESKCKGYCYGDGPLVYGYSSSQVEDGSRRTVRSVRRVGCGEFRYWDGTSCVDARDNPPK